MRSLIRLALFGFAVAVVAACNGGSAAPRATGPAAMLILSGNNQTAQVAAPSFPSPVQGQLYRAPNGQVAWRWSEFLLPAKAEAGTTVTVNGAPITNAVVCWADVPGAPKLIPFSVCTNTDNNGKASFSIRPDTAAGKAKGQIHWDSAGTPIVTDSVLETVTPGALYYWGATGYNPGTVSKGDTLRLIRFFSGFRDRYGNAITADTVVAHTKVWSAWLHLQLVGNGWQCVPHAPTDSSWVITVPDSVASYAPADANGENACLALWIVRDSATDQTPYVHVH